MKSDVGKSLPLFLALGAFLCPLPSWASKLDNTQTAQAASAPGSRQAARMVSASIQLKTGIDARKFHPGDKFEAVLDRDIHFKDGSELKGGTTLVGEITTDQMTPGNARMALRFTNARLKNGQSIPIKATVMEIAPPQDESGYYLGDEGRLWNRRDLRVDQVSAFRGVDMHSNIAAHDSVVFVSQKENDVKLAPMTQMVLAIAKRQSQRAAGANGGA